MDPILEGAIAVDSNFRDVSKEKAKILEDIILVVKEGATNLANIITACSQHLLGRAVVWPAYCFFKKVELTGSNHVTHARYVIKYSPHLCIVYSLFLYRKH